MAFLLRYKSRDSFQIYGCKYNTVMRPSYHSYGNPQTDKRSSLYRVGPLVVEFRSAIISDTKIGKYHTDLIVLLSKVPMGSMCCSGARCRFMWILQWSIHRLQHGIRLASKAEMHYVTLTIARPVRCSNNSTKALNAYLLQAKPLALVDVIQIHMNTAKPYETYLSVWARLYGWLFVFAGWQTCLA